jgi:hypothetical protein
MTLKEAMPLISKLYESFGVKSMILLKDNKWINVVTVIHLTRRKVEDLNNEYRFLVERLGKIDDDNFKIIFQAKPISEFDCVVTELENGYLNIGDLRARLLVRDPKIAGETISDTRYVVRSGEYAEYDCYSIVLTMDDVQSNILSKSGISASALGLRDFKDLAVSWLDLDSFNSTINILLVFPIYAAVGGILYQGGNEIKANLRMDRRLFDNSYIWLTRKGPGDPAPVLERINYVVASLNNVQQNGFAYVSLIHNFSAVGPNDRISVSLLHKELGLLNQKEISVSQLIPQTSDPFSQTFTLFDAGKRMEEHLLNPNKDEDFVASVSWLFEMIDIPSLRLGRDENVREDKTEKGSADLIAYNSESKEVLVIDCTISVPSTAKIDKIRSTADYISRRITCPVKAVIITADKSPAQKDAASKWNVKIIDNADLEKMIGFYKKGHKHPAKRIVFDNA